MALPRGHGILTALIERARATEAARGELPPPSAMAELSAARGSSPQSSSSWVTTPEDQRIETNASDTQQPSTTTELHATTDVEMVDVSAAPDISSAHISTSQNAFAHVPRLPTPLRNADERQRILTANTGMEPPSTQVAVDGHALNAPEVSNTSANQAPAVRERHCIICQDIDINILIKPCSHCSHEYCQNCVAEMFSSAIADRTRMPPKCCTMLQIHIGINLISPEEATKFRKAFEEYMATERVYCPLRTCSAFIPDRYVESPKQESPSHNQKIAEELEKIVERMTKSQFAGSMGVKKPGSNPRLHEFQQVLRHAASKGSPAAFLAALDKYISARIAEEEGDKKVLTTSGDGLRRLFQSEIGKMFCEIDIDLQKGSSGAAVFACPTCSIAICSTCRKVAHTDQPCDTTEDDYEMALAQQYGLRRCPKCKIGVKRMYGCNHIACLCGAHWCYRCEVSIDKCICDGDGAESEEDYEAEEEEQQQEEIAEGNEGVPAAGIAQARAGQANATHGFVDLDAGGSRRWEANEDLDFGDEPSDSGRDVWSCRHRLKLVRPADGFAMVGPDTILECNKCFTKMKASPPYRPNNLLKASWRRNKTSEPASVVSTLSPSSTRSTLRPQTITTMNEVTQQQTAWGCTTCNVVFCEACKKVETAKKHDD